MKGIDLASELETQLPAGEPVDKTWTVSDAAALYGIEGWSQDLFGINDAGKVYINAPTESGNVEVELSGIVEALKQRDLHLPAMLRVENLIRDRIDRLYEAFRRAIRAADYQGDFRGVFPIKVNQQSHVISEIARLGAPYAHGLEAGSKPELLIAVSSLNSTDALIVCNGYKDQEFIDLGLQVQKIGFNCFFVIESLEELDVILRRAAHWGVPARLGVRLKLSTRVEGHWAADSGDRSLFGLPPRHLVAVIDRLREEGRLDWLEMVHFHLGSQIPDIGNLRSGIGEACRYYHELVKEGAGLKYLNIGGGLAVDYTGAQDSSTNSRNYDLDEYCVDVVEGIRDALDPHGVPHPHIVTESGRWTVAPMSILLFDILGVNDFREQLITDEMRESGHPVIQRLIDVAEHIDDRRLQENLNDVLFHRTELRYAFQAGSATLRERAMGENLCLTILNRIAERAARMKNPPAVVDELPNSLADIYYGNFSVFQSLPDAWAIGQIFPIMPIQRLDEAPTQNAIIADLTCDCDGKLDRFATCGGEVSRTLRLHHVEPKEEYVLGVFLVGAYQETLSDLHNLFGDNQVATVRIHPDGQLEFLHKVRGDTLAEVLRNVEYQPREMVSRFRSLAENAVRAQRVSVSECEVMIDLFEATLKGDTYLRDR